MTIEVDVVVVGGGPAGATAACALGKKGLHTVLVEANAVPKARVGETLAPESRQVLQTIGVWEDFLRGGHLPSHGNCSAWSSEALLEQDFIFNPHGCGWQLDRARFEWMLLSSAEKAGVEVLCGGDLKEIRRRESIWEIDLASRKIQAPWLIDATGRRSMFARQMGMPRVMLDQLVSIYVMASPMGRTDQDSRTIIEARPDGWWYSALTPNGRRTVAFQSDADLMQNQPWRDPQWFRERCRQTKHVAALLNAHGYAVHETPKLTSAHSGRLEQCCGEGWLAVGDAAQSFDPLSGQGIFNALLTGQRAADALSLSWPNPADAVLKYADWMDDLWNRFLKDRESFYAAETRWPSTSFWRRRHHSY